MNYKSQMKAWGIDRATAALKVSGEKLDIATVLAGADEILAYTYQVDEDYDDFRARLNDLAQHVELLKLEETRDFLASVIEQRQPDEVQVKQ